MRKKIGVDLDNTIAPTCEYLLHRINGELGTSKVIGECENAWLEMNFGERFFEAKKIIRGILESDELAKVGIMPEARDVLNSISAVADIYIITARDEGTKVSTFESLYSSGLIFDPSRVYFSGEKGRLASAIGLEVFVEDYGDFAIDIANNGIPVLLLEYRWNERFRNAHDLVYPVSGWEDIRCFFRGFLGLEPF